MRKIFRKTNIFKSLMRIRGLEMLLFPKILRTYLMDDPKLFTIFQKKFCHRCLTGRLVSQKQLQRNIQINFCQIISRSSRSSRLHMFHKNVNVKISSNCYSPAAWKFIEKEILCRCVPEHFVRSLRTAVF